MKTTVDIADALLAEAKAAAAARGTTLRHLIEQGLENVLAGDPTRPAFTLRDASVGGKGAPNWHELTDDERLAAMYGGSR